MGVLLDRGRARAIRRHRCVTIETEFVGGLPQLRIVIGAVNVVATEAGHSSPIHYALHEIISLHTVLVRSAVGEMRKGLIAEFVFFELPEIAKIQANAVANRPIEIPSFHRIFQWATLRMAADAGV